MGIQRSKPYPSFSLDEAVSRIMELRQKAGIQQKYTKEVFAQGIGYKNGSNGAFIRAIAALSQYNLVIKDGDGYTLTSTARSILNPTSETAVDEAVRAAAVSPDLFKSLYEDYKGSELPTLLPNILVQNYGILDGVKTKAQHVFMTSMEYAGLLDGNTLLGAEQLEGNSIELEKKTPYTEEVAEIADKIVTTTVPSTSLTKDFGEGRVATIIIPGDITDEERSKIVVLLQNM